MIIKLLGVTAAFTIVPLLMGLAYNRITNWLKEENDYDLPVIYVRGYILYLAVFWMYRLGVSKFFPNAVLHRPVLLWGGILFAGSIFCLAIVNVDFIRIYERIKSTWDQFRSLSKKDWLRSQAWILFCVILTLISVVFVVPSMYDDTIEKGFHVIATEGLEAEGTSVIEMFYVFPAQLFGAGLTQMVHLITPLGLLPLFFFVYVWIAQMLFPQGQDEQRFFFLSVLIFYICMIFANAHIGLMPLQNIWNGTTLAMSCLLPLEVMHVSRLIPVVREMKNNGFGFQGKQGTDSLILLMDIILSAMAVQLSMPWGMGICALLIMLALVAA